MTGKMFEDLHAKLDASMSVFQRDLSGLRTGRASVHLVDNVLVDVYGSKMPINQTASVSILDNKTISIQVWDNSVVKNVIKAIESTLNLNPICEGQSIRLILPDLTEERRKEICKLVAKYSETAKVSSRNIRRDFIDKIKKMEKGKEINEDESKRLADEVQKLIDEFSKKVDQVSDLKEKEIMRV